MKTYKAIVLSVVLSVILLVSVALPASAEAARIEVTVFESDCANGFDKFWMEGQVVHIQNYIHTNRLVSSTPELNGINRTVASGAVNTMNGNGAVTGSFSLKPDTIDGTWEGTFLSITTHGLDRAWAVGQGKGALAGKTLFLDIYSDSSTTNLCGDLGTWDGNHNSVGYILEKGS